MGREGDAVGAPQPCCCSLIAWQGNVVKGWELQLSAELPHSFRCCKLQPWVHTQHCGCLVALVSLLDLEVSY